MAATPTDFPPPWEAQPQADGWHVVALGDSTEPSFGPFTEPTARLIASVHRVTGALRDWLAATTPTAKARAQRMAEAALAQAEGR